MYDYLDYLKKYARKHELAEEEAAEHAIVKDVKNLEEETREKITHCSEGGEEHHA